MLVGVLVYNEILVLQWFGFNRYTKLAMAKREYSKEERTKISYEGGVKNEQRVMTLQEEDDLTENAS